MCWEGYEFVHCRNCGEYDHCGMIKVGCCKKEKVNKNVYNQILSDLYTDKITIKEACETLGKTREEIWNLLDSFKYLPTSEDVLKACEIEKNL